MSATNRSIERATFPMPQQPADDHVDIVQENPTGSPDAPAIVLAESQESQEASIADPQSSRTFRQFSSAWSAVLLLLILSFVMVIIYLLLFPLMGDPALINDPVQSALPGLFPWLAEISWTTALPQVVAQVARIPWLNPLQPGAGRANLQMLLLVLACACMLLAAWVGNRVARLRISRGHARVLFWVILLSTVTFGAMLLLAPVRLDAMSRDMLVSGLYGRMMVVYHVNPYVVSPAIFQHDMLYSAFLHVPATLSLPSTATAGPVWMDLSLLVALLARDSTANILLGFRLVGLVAHLVSATLVWSLLGELKPEMRLASMIFYAWNPLILLFGVFAVHLEIVVILFLLLAFVFFQRDALVLSWVFALLAVLVNVLCLPLLLLIGHMSMKKARLLRARRHAYWWLAAVLVSAVVVLLAYLPYWQQAGSVVFTAGLFQAFWPDHVTNSLAEALINLPVQLPAVVVWLVDPHHWALCALVIIALFFLLALWVADTLDSVLVCGSWLFLLLLILMPAYWPWFVLLPLALALCSTDHNTRLLALLLMVGAIVDYYCWQWPQVWTGQALVAVWLPLLLWGWMMFFSSLWHVSHNARKARQ